MFEIYFPTKIDGFIYQITGEKRESCSAKPSFMRWLDTATVVRQCHTGQREKPSKRRWQQWAFWFYFFLLWYESHSRAFKKMNINLFLCSVSEFTAAAAAATAATTTTTTNEKLITKKSVSNFVVAFFDAVIINQQTCTQSIDKKKKKEVKWMWKRMWPPK